MFRFGSAILTVLVVFTTTLSLQAQQNAQKYTLQYKLKRGETLVSKVVHLAETQTTMAALDETSHSRTTSEKVWEVKSVDAKGLMTFEYRINAVDMAQSVADGEELSYNSRTDEEIPGIFKHVAETVNKPLATVTINSQGQVVNRDKELKAPQLGMGELTIPLPATPVAINGQWSVPRDLRVKLDSGAHKTIKIRELYTLEKVSAGVATIRIETQPLTPVKEPSVEAKLMQQMSQGEIKFDIDAGRMLSKKLNWEEEIVGFQGADTRLRYDAKFTEELLPASKRTASRNNSRK